MAVTDNQNALHFLLLIIQLLTDHINIQAFHFLNLFCFFFPAAFIQPVVSAHTPPPLSKLPSRHLHSRHNRWYATFYFITTIYQYLFIVQISFFVLFLFLIPVHNFFAPHLITPNQSEPWKATFRINDLTHAKPVYSPDARLLRSLVGLWLGIITRASWQSSLFVSSWERIKIKPVPQLFKPF